MEFINLCEILKQINWLKQKHQRLLYCYTSTIKGLSIQRPHFITTILIKELKPIKCFIKNNTRQNYKTFFFWDAIHFKED